MQRSFHKNFLFLIFLIAGLFASAQKYRLPHVAEEWSKEYAPFCIAGNLYYVGTYDLACYLVTTPGGHILINTGLEASVPMIRSHIESLGFKFQDIKILLTTQVHYDHVAGMAEIKKQTGARMMVHAQDAQALADGGSSDYAMGGNGELFEPLKADRILKDRDTLSLGGTDLVLLHHPGHTKGSSSFLLKVKDKQRAYTVLIANLPTIIVEGKLSAIAGYPDAEKDYAYTLKAMKALKFDLWVASHASQFNLHKKRKPSDAYNPSLFADRKAYDAELARLEKEYKEAAGRQ